MEFEGKPATRVETMARKVEKDNARIDRRRMIRRDEKR
jgi:hypothetical protein